MSSINPFKGRIAMPSAPMRVLHRFTKPGGNRAEIRERKVTQFRAIEFIVYVHGSLLESQMFHNGREAEYPTALASRIEGHGQMTSKYCGDAKWVCELHPASPYPLGTCEAPGIPCSICPRSPPAS